MNALRGLDITMKGLGMTDRECCDGVIDQNTGRTGGGGRAGSIVCCGGRIIPCAWDHESDPETLALKSRATLIHEGVHAKDASVHLLKDPRTACKPTELKYKGVPDLEASECRAYATELPWLEKAYDECTTDYCRREFDRQIRFTTRPQNGGPTPGEPCGRGGDWMACYCRQAGMQIPAEAVRIGNRFASMERPKPLPPKNLEIPKSTYHPAPTIEYPLNDEYKEPPPPPPPALVAVAGGRPDNSGMCPNGWSYAKIDGVLGCRNNATGTFRKPSGELMGLSGLGANKKKKPVPKPAPRVRAGTHRGGHLSPPPGTPTGSCRRAPSA